MKINDAIKTRILNLCAENKITINELAALSGLRATTIYSVISGKVKIQVLEQSKKYVVVLVFQ